MNKLCVLKMDNSYSPPAGTRVKIRLSELSVTSTQACASFRGIVVEILLIRFLAES